MPPAELEDAYYRHHTAPATAEAALSSLHRTRYGTTKAAAKRGVSAWIEATYNRTRRHSSLGMLSPVTFEHWFMTPAAEAA